MTHLAEISLIFWLRSTASGSPTRGAITSLSLSLATMNIRASWVAPTTPDATAWSCETSDDRERKGQESVHAAALQSQFAESSGSG